MELTRDEKLAFLKALEKMVKKELETLEAEAKDEVMAGFIKDGRDRRPLIINNRKVGDISLRYSAAKVAIRPGWEREAMSYLEDCGLIQYKPVTGWEKRFMRVGTDIIDKKTGEVVDFLEWLPRVASTATINECKPEDVIPAFESKGYMFNAMFAGLLEG